MGLGRPGPAVLIQPGHGRPRAFTFFSQLAREPPKTSRAAGKRICDLNLLMASLLWQSTQFRQGHPGPKCSTATCEKTRRTRLRTSAGAESDLLPRHHRLPRRSLFCCGRQIGMFPRPSRTGAWTCRLPFDLWLDLKTRGLIRQEQFMKLNERAVRGGGLPGLPRRLVTEPAK